MSPPQGDDPGVALVTGAGRRIGAAIARHLAGRGHAVALHHMNSATETKVLRDEIAAAGGKAAPFQADLRDADAVRALIPTVTKELGPVTTVVNSASRFEPDGIGNLDDDRWAAHFDLHVRAPVYLIDAMAAALPAGRSGVAINLIDQRVLRPTPHFISYTLSKSALWTATQTLAQALAPRIRVCAIGPGPTLANDRQSAEDFSNQQRLVPLQRGPSLDEICRTVQFILDMPSLTGVMITPDGGQHLAWQTPDVTGAKE